MNKGYGFIVLLPVVTRTLLRALRVTPDAYCLQYYLRDISFLQYNFNFQHYIQYFILSHASSTGSARLGCVCRSR